MADRPTFQLTFFVAFEHHPVHYNDLTSAIFSDARLFELADYQSHRRPPDPEHLRQELLG
jgi:hypothetical protein